MQKRRTLQELVRSTADFEDEFVEQLQASIMRIKSSREMGERFMLFEEMMRNERAEGKAGGNNRRQNRR